MLHSIAPKATVNPTDPVAITNTITNQSVKIVHLSRHVSTLSYARVNMTFEFVDTLLNVYKQRPAHMMQLLIPRERANVNDQSRRGRILLKEFLKKEGYLYMPVRPFKIGPSSFIRVCGPLEAHTQ